MPSPEDFPPAVRETVSRLEDAVGRTVACHDGGERKVMAVTPTHVTYAVECGTKRPWWMRLSPTHRRYVERDFIGAPYVTEAKGESNGH